MLLRFRVSNFRSINDTEELSMVATKLKHDNKRVDLIATSDRIGLELVPSLVIYGPNGAGKSNLLNALSFLRSAIEHSHQKGGAFFSLKNLVDFRLADSSDRPCSTFEIVIEIAGVRHDYMICVSNKEVHEESLYHYPNGVRSLIFKRTLRDKMVFGRVVTGRDVRSISSLVGDAVLFVSVAKELKFAPAIAVSDAIESIDYFDADGVSPHQFGDFFTDFPMKQAQLAFLRQIGTGIQDYRIEESEIPLEVRSINEKLKSAFRDLSIQQVGGEFEPPSVIRLMQLQHRSAGGRVVYFPAIWESAGTIRLLALMSFVFGALERGTTLLVDEVDISLHTGVVDAIFSLFALKETNPNGAQLIVTTHDTNLLNSKYLRRDQIWFAEKDEGGASHFTPLSDFAVRKDAPIEAGYLQGRFGAIPFAGAPEKLFGS